MSTDSKFVYLNHQQSLIRHISPRHLRFVAARRSGKTHGVLAPYMHGVQKSMPCSSGIFTGVNRKQILGRTLPAIFTSWRTIWGLVEGENFCVGRPPQKLNYPDPFYKPIHWENTVSFANGFLWYLISMQTTASANGLSVSSVCGDEVRFIPRQRLDSEVMPCLSGVPDRLGGPERTTLNPFYKSTGLVTDASLSARGNWMEHEDSHLDEVIDSGPNKGKTRREVQQQLEQHAYRIMDINEKIYFAKKHGRKPIVASDAELALAKELRRMCRAREGKFRVLPNGDNSEANCKRLTQLGVLQQREAELLYNADYLLSQEDYFWMKFVATSDKYQREIRQLRCDCFGFFQGSTIDNIALLGEDYIKTMRSTLSPLVFNISILGQKVKFSGEGYYFALDIEGKHGYIDNEDNGVIDDNTFVKKVSRVYNGATYTAETESPDFERLSGINDCRMDGDVTAEDNLYIAMDYNARINWVTVGVCKDDPDNRNTSTCWVVNSMFVKTPDRIEELIKRFNHYYAPHRRQNPNITYFYDATAKQGKNYALAHSEDFKDVVIRLLEQAGWHVTAIDMGVPMSHDTKYREINNGLMGISAPAVRINREKNEDLIIALEHADVEQGYNGFRKSKAGEKLPYNPDLEGDGAEFAGKQSNIKEEHRSDGTDSFDSLYLGCKYFRFGGGDVFACC